MPRATTDANSGHISDVIIHQSVWVGDVPGLLAVCRQSARLVGLGEHRALKFVGAVGRGLLDAFGLGDGPPVLTLEREGAVLLVAQVAVHGAGDRAAEVDCWREPRTSRLVDAGTSRPNQRGATLRLVAAVHSGPQVVQLRRHPTPNGGRFTRLPVPAIRHFT
jgi:hypothetical protein